MLPFGLKIQKFKPIRKIPMRLVPISFEDQKKYYNTLLNLSTRENPKQTRERKVKKNKTSKAKIH